MLTASDRNIGKNSRNELRFFEIKHRQSRGILKMCKGKQHVNHSGRKILSRSRSTFRTVARNTKAGNSAAYESLLQYHWSLWFEWDDSVLRYYEEISSVRIPHLDRITRYSADFEVHRINGDVELVEIKPSRQLERPKVAERLSAIEKHLKGGKRKFLILTEHDLPVSDIGLSNLRRLNRIRRASQSMLSELRSQIPSKPTTLDELTRTLPSMNPLRLMAHKLVQFDINQKVTPLTVLLPMGGSSND